MMQQGWGGIIINRRSGQVFFSNNVNGEIEASLGSLFYCGGSNIWSIKGGGTKSV